MSDYAGPDRPLTVVHKSQGQLWTTSQAKPRSDFEVSSTYPQALLLGESKTLLKALWTSQDVRLRALEIVRPWWERQSPRPRQPFIAIVKIIESALKGGWEPAELSCALTEVPCVSGAALDFWRNRRKPRRRSDGLDAVRRMLEEPQ